MLYILLALFFIHPTLSPVDAPAADATIADIERAIHAIEEQIGELELRMPVIIAQSEDAQRVAANVLYATETLEKNKGFFKPCSWKIPLKPQVPQKNKPRDTQKTLTPTVPRGVRSFIVPARPEQRPDNRDWYTFTPQSSSEVGAEEQPFKRPDEREEGLRQELHQALLGGHLFVEQHGGKPLDSESLKNLPEHGTLFIDTLDGRRPLTLLENYLAHRRWYATNPLQGTLHDCGLHESLPFTGTHYCVVDAPTVVRRLDNGEFVDEHFFRSDGAIVPKNRLDLAFGFYEGFGKQIALLGAETVATTFLYERIKKASIEFKVQALLKEGAQIVQGHNLKKKLRFIPWNLFNPRIRGFVLLYAALEEAVYLAEKYLTGPYVFDKVREKLANPLASIIEHRMNRASLEYATGVPISAYSVVEFFTTGRFSGLESASELLVGQPKTKTVHETVASVALSQALHFLRRFLIAFLTLRYIDDRLVSAITKAIEKDKKGFLSLLRQKDEGKLRAFIEGALPRANSPLSWGLHKFVKTKKASVYLQDARLVYTQRLKARWTINTLFCAGIALKKFHSFLAFFNKK